MICKKWEIKRKFHNKKYSKVDRCGPGLLAFYLRQGPESAPLSFRGKDHAIMPPWSPEIQIWTLYCWQITKKTRGSIGGAFIGCTDVELVKRLCSFQWPLFAPWAVRPEKNRQMSIKVAQKWFHLKKFRLWQLYKNCLKIWEIWAN